MSPKRANVLKIILFFLCVVLPLGAWLGFGKQGLFQLYRTERNRQAQVARILRLAEENQALLDEIHRLNNDMDYLASIARKELNLIKKNEMIYRFEGDNEQPAKAGTPADGEKAKPGR
jgi:cell division protein FtsB